MRTVRGLFEAVVTPSRFVALQRGGVDRSAPVLSSQTVRLLGVLLLNVALYAGPLTLAGIGFTTQGSAPGWFTGLVAPLTASPTPVWQFLVGTVQNSVFLVVATGLALVTFHTSVVLTARSRGFVPSLQTVVYTTSVYLAGIFTIVSYMSTTDQVAGAEELTLNLQAAFIRRTLDLVGFAPPAFVPEDTTLTLEGVGPTGELLLAALLLLAVYFLYSMYLGARINHRLDRARSALVVGSVLASPVLYLLGSAAATVLFERLGLSGPILL